MTVDMVDVDGFVAKLGRHNIAVEPLGASEGSAGFFPSLAQLRASKGKRAVLIALHLEYQPPSRIDPATLFQMRRAGLTHIEGNKKRGLTLVIFVRSEERPVTSASGTPGWHRYEGLFEALDAVLGMLDGR